MIGDMGTGGGFAQRVPSPPFAPLALARSAGLFYQPALPGGDLPGVSRACETDRWRSGRSRTLGKRV